MDKPAHVDPANFLEKVFQANSAETLVLVGLGLAVWLIGGNLLVAWHYRRMGKSPWSGLRPFAFPFKNFNSREWLIMAVLAITSLVLFGFALGWR
jgi:hypothetical protein